MKFKTLFLTGFMLLIAAATAGAWGLPNVLSSATSSSADPDPFLAKAKRAERLIERSADSLFRAVASKEEQAKIEEMQKKMNETADEKEKNALRQQITESEMATIEKRAADKQLQEDAKQWDERKKRQVANASYNFSLGSLQAAALVPEGMRIADSIRSNPVNAVRLAVKLGSVIDAISAMKGIITNTGKVLGAMKPLMSAANIEAKTPSSASESPKEIEGGI